LYIILIYSVRRDGVRVRIIPITDDYRQLSPPPIYHIKYHTVNRT